MLDASQIEEITALIADAAARAAVTALKEANMLSDTDHHNHHNWIASQIKKDEARIAMYDELTKHVAKWGSVGVLSSIFYGLYLVFKEASKR